MRETILVAVLLAFGCPVWAESERLVVFVSDLHLGIGPAKGKPFDPFEDARWSSDWKGFLDAIDRRGKSKTDLVLNGDTFELWQALAVPCGDGAARHGCNAAQASERLAHIVAAHTEELAALATFVKSGGNRVILVPGNHDAALMYPDVAAEAVKAMGGRVIVRTNGYWLSDDQLVYAEHGHQIKPEANSFPSWPLPFANGDPTGYLESPWGEGFVVDFYNPYERIYPVIDNISNEFEAFSIARRAEGAAHTALGVARLVAFLFGKVTPRQFVQGLGRGDPQDTLPVWNLDKIAKDVESREGANQFAVDSFPTDGPLYTDAKEAAARRETLVAPAELTRERLQEVCDFRAMLHQQQLIAGRQPTVKLCETKQLGAITARLLGRSEQNRQEHFTKVRQALQPNRSDKTSIQVIVIGHTHVLEAAHPLFGEAQGWNPKIANSGAWQRTISTRQLEELAKAATPPKTAAQLLAEPLQPEGLPPCYGVVLIDPYPRRPLPLVHYWKVGTDGTGRLVSSSEPSCPQG